MSDPNNPFNWRMRTEPSIFAQDPQFRPKGADGKTGGQIMTEVLDKRRATGKDPGTIFGIGVQDKEKEERLLAYRQFGTYSRATPSIKKPNKHEK